MVCIALFRTVRKIISPFATSNPTWIKRAKNNNLKISLTKKILVQTFTNVVNNLCRLIQNEVLNVDVEPDIFVADSLSLPMESSSFDACLTSPPYCTRIDYVITSLPELSLLSNSSKYLELLRSQMIGTTIVPDNNIMQSEMWGKTCVSMLEKVKNHQSKASSTYYSKTFIGYFDRIFCSINEIARLLRKGGNFVIVTQGSYYKNILIDLPLIIREMSLNLGFEEIESIILLTNKVLVKSTLTVIHMVIIIIWLRWQVGSEKGKETFKNKN